MENKNKIKLKPPLIAAPAEGKTETVSGSQQRVFDVFQDFAGFYAV